MHYKSFLNIKLLSRIFQGFFAAIADSTRGCLNPAVVTWFDRLKCFNRSGISFVFAFFILAACSGGAVSDTPDSRQINADVVPVLPVATKAVTPVLVSPAKVKPVSKKKNDVAKREPLKPAVEKVVLAKTETPVRSPEKGIDQVAVIPDVVKEPEQVPIPKQVVADSPVLPALPLVSSPPVLPEAMPSVAVDNREKEEDILIDGSMTMDFATRAPGADLLRARDRYDVDISVDKLFRLSGVIHRTPRVLSRFLGREKQPLQFSYGLAFIDLAAAHSQIIQRQVGAQARLGTLQGVVSVSPTGVYGLGAQQGSLLIKSLVPRSMSDSYAGSIQGRPEDRSGAVSSILREYTRWSGGRKVKMKSRKVDPLTFNNIVLAAGPGDKYPSVNVTGNLDYDYETGNWLTTGIEFGYEIEGKALRDTVTGSIKWVEDPDRKANGRGQYEFNLRYNESTSGGNEEVFFENVPDEEAFFVVDNKAPHLGGVVAYQDLFIASAKSENAEQTVISSVARYRMKAHRLTEQQAVNFLKLWILVVGPMNDE